MFEERLTKAMASAPGPIRRVVVAAEPMTEADFRSLYTGLRAQVPWDAQDRRGALNYLTPAERLAAERGRFVDVFAHATKLAHRDEEFEGRR